MPDSDEPHPKPQRFSDKDREKQTMEFLEKENLSLKEIVARLSEIIIRNITGKKK